MALGRPVKFVADRLESFVSDIHARENRVARPHGREQEGRHTRRSTIDVLSGAGAYSQYPRTSVFEANQILTITGGPYKHKHFRGTASVVYLNKVPTSQYRAVGHPIGNSVGEALVDLAAEATGLDPVEIRRRNIMPDDGYPATTAAGLRVKELSHQRCLEALVERMDYAALASGAGGPAQEGHPLRHRHRGVHQGHRAGPARLLRRGRRADRRRRKPARSSSTPAAASSARSA